MAMAKQAQITVKNSHFILSHSQENKRCELLMLFFAVSI